MAEKLNALKGTYWMNRWPHRATIYTRGNLKDMAPTAVTPLTEDLFCHHETAGSIKYYKSDLDLRLDIDSFGPWIAGFFGHLFVNVHCVGEVGDKIPGSSDHEIYKAFFGLVADPSWSATAAPAEDAGRFIAKISSRSETLAQRVQEHIRALVALRPDLEEPINDRALSGWLSNLCSSLTTSFSLLIEGATNASILYSGIGHRLTLLNSSFDDAFTNSLHVDLQGVGSADSGDAARKLAAALAQRPQVAALVRSGAALADIRQTDSGLAEQIDDFIRAYGHRGPGEIELGNPTWRSNTHRLLNWLLKLSPGSSEVHDHRFTASAIRIKAEAELSKHCTWQSVDDPIGRLLSYSRSAMKIRENAKEPLLYNLDELRRLLDVLGTRLRERGLIERPDDLLFLRSQELETAVEGALPDRRAIHERRAAFDWVKTLAMPDFIQTSDGFAVTPDAAFFTGRGLLPPGVEPSDAASEEASDRLLIKALGASPGIVDGRVRLMHHPFDDFEPGDVLVACTVDPGWAPVLASASAVVLELGGPLSHGAVVARELGIPCVVNAKGALDSIQNGSRITVDGAAGTVSAQRKAK